MKQVIKFLGLLATLSLLLVSTGCEWGSTTTQYTLTVATSGNGSVSTTGGTYDEGTTVTLTATPASGWVFTGWSGNAVGTSATIQITMDANKTVVANFSEESTTTRYTLSVSTSGSGSVSPTGGTYDAGTTVTLYATPASGWTFSGWSGSVSGSSTSIQVTMNSNKSVLATFTEVQSGSSELTYQAEESSYSNAVVESEHSGYTGSGYVNFDNETGSSMAFTVKAASSGNATLAFRFANGASASRPMDVEVNGSVQISSLAFDATGAWTTWNETTATVYLSSGSNTIELVSSGSDGGPNMDRVIVAGNLEELTSYTLTVYTSGNGSVTPSGGSYTEGSNVPLTATPADGWLFSSWSGGASGSSASVTVTMNSNVTVTANFTEDQNDTPEYDNWPLTGDLGVHDPSMIKENGVYYIFGTGVGIPYKRSYDGLAWSDAGTVFNSYPSWADTYVPDHESNIWAPDINYYNGTYYLYYSVSTFGSNVSAIGLATCTSLASQNWQDQGLVIRSTSSSDSNCIDPDMVVDRSGNVWMVFGSFWTGIKIVQLDPATLKLKSGATVHSLATRDNTAIEGACIVYRSGYYYLFASVDFCCQGVDSTLKIMYGRASSITGPYYDKNGVRMLDGGGSLFDAGNTRWIGPGGQCIMGTDTIAHHAYDYENNGAATLMIKTMQWDSDGWPYRGDEGDTGGGTSSSGLVGFASMGSGTTGGAGGTTVTVSNASSFLNYAQASGSYIIKVSGTISLSGMNKVASNKTIIGQGSSAVISGGGLNLSGVSNIIIQNITFTGADDDSINIQEQSNHIWIDHCDFTNGYDGLLDIKRQSSYITVSWNHFYNHRKTCLLGHSDSNTEDAGYLKVTYHHNWFDNTYSRHPRVRFGHVHVFNNYYVGNDYGVASTMAAEVLVEGNYFSGVKSPTLVGYGSSDVGDLVQRNNVFNNCTNSPQTRGSVPSFSYSYSLDSASSIPSIVSSGAGVGKM